MAARTAPSVLSLAGVALGDRGSSPAVLDLELGRGQVAIVEMKDREHASLLVDLCVGLADPPAGVVRFLDLDWGGQSYRERLGARRRIGTVVDVLVWPVHLSIADSVLAPQLYHGDRSEQEAVAQATSLARMFGLPGLPMGRREATPPDELVRAACVRGFLGAPDLVVVQDPAIDGTAALGVAMAQAIAAVQDRGGAALWIVESMAAAAARHVRADQTLRLADRQLIQVRRNR